MRLNLTTKSLAITLPIMVFGTSDYGLDARLRSAAAEEHHVTLEITHLDGRTEPLAAQSADLCNTAIDAWRRGLWHRDDGTIRVMRCVDRDSFAPGSFRAAPREKEDLR